MDLCYNYDFYEDYKKELMVCYLMIREDFKEYFQEYYQEGNLQRVGRIVLPDFIKEKVKRKIELIQSVKEFIQKHGLTLGDSLKLQMFILIEKEFGGHLNFFNGNQMEEIYQKIEEERKPLLFTYHEMYNNTVTILEQIQLHYQNEQNIQQIHKSESLSNQRIEDHPYLLDYEKRSFVLLGWI